MDAIKVSLMRRDGRPSWECQWTDPTTGRKRTRTTGTPIRRDAERYRTRLEDELNRGEWFDAGKVTWEDFRERFETVYLTGRKPKTGEVYDTVFNHVERHISPALLAAVDGPRIASLAARLRESGCGEVSLKTYLAHLRTALRWAHSQKLLRVVPPIDMPAVRPRMKGRPITTEELERMIARVPDAVGAATVEAWRWLLRGLWWSGLRIGEAVELSWDPDAPFAVDLSHEYPMFRIEAEAEKGGRDRLLPVAPEFGEMLLSVPEAERTGYVLRPPRDRAQADKPGPITAEHVGRIIGRLGQLANVKVAEKRGKVKWASAHDCRRAFGFRWAARVMPPVLMELMRHEDIKTSMTFYVGRNAEATAAVVWSAFANVSANARESAALEPNDLPGETARAV